MTVRVGLAVSADAIRAVALTRRGIFWRHEVVREPETSLASGIDALLAAAPIPRWPRPVLAAAIGPHASQVKSLSRLPPVDDPTLLAALVRESASAFFLRNGSPLVTTGIRSSSTGEVLAGAIDLPYVETIRDVCRARGWRLGPIAPVAVALPFAFEDTGFAWNDGHLMLDVVSADRALTSVRCRKWNNAAASTTAATPVPELAAVGDDSVKYADAYGAAQLDAAEPLVVDLIAHQLLGVREIWRPLFAPAAVLLAALVALAAAPLYTIWSARSAETRIAAIRPGRWHVVTAALGELDEVTRVLTDLKRFSDSRGNMFELSGQLARRLPVGSAIVSMDVNSDGGQIVTLTSRPDEVLAAVRATPGITKADLVEAGQVPMSGAARQVTVRFTRTAPGAP